MKNKTVKYLWDAAWYIIVFLLIALAVNIAGAFVWSQYSGQDYMAVVNGMAYGSYSQLTILCNIVSGIITIVLFALMKWSPASRRFIRSRPWAIIVWTILLALGSILPMEWLYEQLQLAMDDQTEALFEGIMREPLGYIAIGIMAPIVEEMVFRGAVLRVLFKVFNSNMHWVAISISALIFALVHANLAQGVHAMIAGLLLGWLYYRTNSIVPGIVLHWVNNTVAYLSFNFMPEMNDGKVINLFNGNETTMYMALGFSLLVFLPSLFQLAIRMKK